MSWYKPTSKYTQRMLKLSGKIFGENHWAPMPREVANHWNQVVIQGWIAHQRRYDLQIAEIARKPMDIDIERKPERYPAHPQIRALMYKLREYGLYRDEHLDFKEEMKRLDRLRGKKFRVRGGEKA